MGLAGAGLGPGEAGQAQRPGPRELNRSRESAPGLGTAEAALTCSVFPLPRPEQLAPGCR